MDEREVHTPASAQQVLRLRKELDLPILDCKRILNEVPPTERDRFIDNAMNRFKGLVPESKESELGAREACRMPAEYLKSQVTAHEVESLRMIRPDSERRRFLDQVQPGDEIWVYDTPQDSWDRNMGSCGIVLLRDGVAIDSHTQMMN